MKSKNWLISLILLIVGVIIGYFIFGNNDRQPQKIYVQDKIYERQYIEANKKYDSLRLEFEKKPKKIIINEKIRDTIYILDSASTDSLQQKLLRYYIDNKKRFDPHRFDFIKATNNK